MRITVGNARHGTIFLLTHIKCFFRYRERKLMRRPVSVGLAFSIVLAPLCGCTKKSDSGHVAVEHPKQEKPESGAMLAYPPVPIAFQGAGELWDRELLADSLFTDFDLNGSPSAAAVTGK